jgi:hypothetical protein
MSTDRDVVIIGAPRSGTNMLRDVLTSLPGFATWPCDEINLIWRHGNRSYPSDELGPELATPKVATYIRGRFDEIRRRYDARSVVEKTCANSLRVEFVRAVVPEARIIFITRDGLDATASAIERWHAPLDVRYTAAKARFVPRSDLAYYGGRFVAGRLRRNGKDQNRVRTWWGPKTDDRAALMATRPLDEICLLQWKQCVESSERGLAGLSSDQVHHVSYENFARSPETGLRAVLDFLERPEAFDASAVAKVKASSIGKGRTALSEEARERLGALARPTLQRLGYDAV